MEFTIFSIGDSVFLEQVLIALAMITATADFGAMVQVGLAIGVFSVVLSAISTGGQKIEIQHVLLGWIIYATMFVPTAKVNIEDTYTGEVRVIDNVPIGPAAAGGIISMIGYKLTELFELGYSPIVPSLTKNAFSESLKTLSDIRNKSMQSSLWTGINEDSGGGAIDLQKSWSEYITDCSLKKIDLGITTAHKLYTEPYKTALYFNSSLYGTQLFIDPDSPVGVNYTCAEAWIALNDATLLEGETGKAFNGVLGFNVSNLATGESAITKIGASLDALIPATISANEYMQLAVLEPILGQAAAR